MTHHEISLVQSSLRKITPVADLASALFFARLFEIDPPLREVLQSDFREQQQRLIKLVTFVAFGLEDPESMAMAVRQLAAQQAHSALQDRHHRSIATALLWTLEQILGPAFTAETRAAWLKGCDLFSLSLKTTHDTTSPAR